MLHCIRCLANYEQSDLTELTNQWSGNTAETILDGQALCKSHAYEALFPRAEVGGPSVEQIDAAAKAMCVQKVHGQAVTKVANGACENCKYLAKIALVASICSVRGSATDGDAAR